MGNGRYTIGLVTANICDPFSNQIAKGAMTAAERLDTNMIVVPVKYVGVDSLFKALDAEYEYQYNAMFSHIASHNLDYLIVCIGTIAYAYDAKEKKSLLDLLGDTPILSVASEVEGYENLTFDNKSGIRAAVNFLIRKSNRKRIAILAGDLNNTDCVERFEAYRDTLIENNIEFDESLVMECDLSTYCEAEAEKLISEHTDIDAVICANDAIASALYKVLKKHNIAIGKDIAVTGFDDMPLAQQLDPPLASVKASAGFLGEKAVERAVSYLKGETAPRKKQYLDTMFIPRESCYEAKKLTISNTFIKNNPQQTAMNIVNYIFNAVDSNTQKTRRLFNAFEYYVSEIKNIFDSDEINDERIDLLINALSRQLDNEELYRYANVHKMLEICDLSFQWLIKLTSGKKQYNIVKLYSFLYQKIMHNAIINNGKANINTIEINHRANIITRDILMFDNNDTESYSVILKKLHTLGIDTSYIYMLDQPVEYHNHEIFPKDVNWNLKAYCYGKDTHPVPESKQFLKPKDLFSHEFMPQERRYTYIMADLYSTKYQYGFALVELKYEYFDYLEYLIYQLSAAIKIFNLIYQQRDTLQRLHNSNLALENMSLLDELTGALNRRGFYKRAEEINLHLSSSSKVAVLFADLDDLKIINDTYGHIEGDYAIKTVSDCLREATGDNGIVGRIGGDEFVAICPIYEANKTQDISDRAYTILKNHNLKANKPYTVSMSTGVFESSKTEFSDISTVIDKADYLLYIQKRKKKQMKQTKKNL